MPANSPAESARDLPEWQAAQADYLSDEGTPDEVLVRRLRAARRMHEIDTEFAARLAP